MKKIIYISFILLTLLGINACEKSPKQKVLDRMIDSATKGDSTDYYQGQLAKMYETGIGFTDKDEKKAFFWYSVLALENKSDAYKIAEMTYYGIGTTENADKALSILEEKGLGCSKLALEIYDKNFQHENIIRCTLTDLNIKEGVENELYSQREALLKFAEIIYCGYDPEKTMSILKDASIIRANALTRMGKSRALTLVASLAKDGYVPAKEKLSSWIEYGGCSPIKEDNLWRFIPNDGEKEIKEYLIQKIIDRLSSDRLISEAAHGKDISASGYTEDDMLKMASHYTKVANTCFQDIAKADAEKFKIIMEDERHN